MNTTTTTARPMFPAGTIVNEPDHGNGWYVGPVRGSADTHRVRFPDGSIETVRGGLLSSVTGGPVCAVCVAAGVPDDPTPHTHCPACDGAILDGMDACAWCAVPAARTVTIHGPHRRTVVHTSAAPDARLVARIIRTGATRYAGPDGRVHIVPDGMNHGPAWAATIRPDHA